MPGKHRDDIPFQRTLDALAAGDLGFEVASHEVYERAKAPSRALFATCRDALLSEDLDVLAVGAAGLSWLAKRGPEWCGAEEVAVLLAQSGRDAKADSWIVAALVGLARGGSTMPGSTSRRQPRSSARSQRVLAGGLTI